METRWSHAMVRDVRRKQAGVATQRGVETTEVLHIERTDEFNVNPRIEMCDLRRRWNKYTQLRKKTRKKKFQSCAMHTDMHTDIHTVDAYDGIPKTSHLMIDLIHGKYIWANN